MTVSNIKFGICHFSLPIEGPCAVEIASETGFDGVQLDMIRNYKDQLALAENITQERFMKMGKRSGIEYPSIAVRELDRFSMFDEKDDAAIRAINKAIAAAKNMNIPIILIPNFVNSEIKDDDQFRKAVRILSEACNKTIDDDIIIAHESTLPPDDIERLMKKVDRPNIRLYFDTQNHFLHSGYDMAKLLDRLMPYICEIHVKDGKNKDLSGALLGQGDAGFYKCVEVIKKHNYSGWIITENYYDMEPLSLQSNNPIEMIKKDHEILKEAFA